MTEEFQLLAKKIAALGITMAIVEFTVMTVSFLYSLMSDSGSANSIGALGVVVFGCGVLVVLFTAIQVHSIREQILRDG